MCYQRILPGIDVLEIPQLCRKYKSALWWSQHLNTSKKKSVCILANWIGEDGQIINDNDSLEPCAGRVEYFFSQRLLVGEFVEVNMAQVKWFQEHAARNTFSKPIEIWCHDLFKPFGAASFLPVENIQEVCVICDILINDELVTAVNPIKKKVFL